MIYLLRETKKFLPVVFIYSSLTKIRTGVINLVNLFLNPYIVFLLTICKNIYIHLKCHMIFWTQNYAHEIISFQLERDNMKYRISAMAAKSEKCGQGYPSHLWGSVSFA